jgi:chemotaxis protein CheD
MDIEFGEIVSEVEAPSAANSGGKHGLLCPLPAATHSDTAPTQSHVTMPAPPTPTASISVSGPAARERLDRLKAQPRRSGEASFFWYETQFKRVAVKVLPGEYFVDHDDLMIVTTLGSCIAACLWDGSARVGGMNHFMLPDGDGDSGRFGAFAMEMLINDLLKAGARRASLEAKVFGGGQVIAGMETINVGERNTRFVLDYLRTERIPVVAMDVLDVYPRKVAFLSSTGKAMVKRLSPTHGERFVERERAVVPAAPCGTVDLF